MIVRIKESAYMNHQPPHKPWYISEDYMSVIPLFLKMRFVVTEHQDYYIVDFLLIEENSYLELRKNTHYISKKDVVIL